MYFFKAQFPSELKKDKKGKKKGGKSNKSKKDKEAQSVSLDEQFDEFESQGISKKSLEIYAKKEQDIKTGKKEMVELMQENTGSSK